MEWFRDAKFGMFIHWGIYAVPAGFYKDKAIGGIGEWIMKNGKIPVAEYRAFAKDFNPTAYNPEAWAELAKDAGMKYMVITSKHHDGFTLFPSAASDWNIEQSTPYKKDLIAPLAEAARKNGLKFGLYYSQSQDWTHPGGSKMGMKEGEGWDDAHKGSYDDYLKKIAVPQTKEILDRYKPDIIWWDTPVWMTPERAQPLADLVARYPMMITNNRLGGGFKGDTETPEQHIPATGFKGRDWETCMTLNNTWGYKSNDNNWKSTETLIRNLVDIVSKGGNYLLNIGPKADGTIPQETIDRLHEVGKWMKVNSEAIYGTTASPFTRLTWGRATKKVTPGGTTLYLHVFEWPKDGKLVVPGLKTMPKSAVVLATGEKVTATGGEDITLSLPANAPDDIASVLKLEFDGPLTVESRLPVMGADGKLVLGAERADVNNVLGTHAEAKKVDGVWVVSEWKSDRVTVGWLATVSKAGKFTLEADYTNPGDAVLKADVKVNGKKAGEAVFPGSGGSPKSAAVGTADIPATGNVEIQLVPQKPWSELTVRSLTLSPSK